MKQIRKKTVNIIPKDPIDRLIHNRSVFIRGVIISKSYNIMVVLLGGRLGKIFDGEIIFKLSEFPGLKSAGEEHLNNWRLIAGGIGIHWIDLDEDLSLKRFILSALSKAKKEIPKIEKIKKEKELLSAL